MIIEWFQSVFTLLGVEMPTQVKIFGIGINYNDLIMTITISLMVFFVLEIVIGINSILERRFK